MLKGALKMSKTVTTRDIKLISIGNSKGLRLPKPLLQKYGWSDSLVLEERDEGIYLYSKEKNKLSWQETYRAIAAEDEDWSDLDVTVADGLE
jgi:antitoxin MazE